MSTRYALSAGSACGTGGVKTRTVSITGIRRRMKKMNEPKEIRQDEASYF